jgi:arylsulfatase A-like enzyme
MSEKMNVLVIMTDTFRTANVGCYGSTDTQTPNLDRFAASGARFTQAYPESLPTIPVRRALHTGRRAYPFHDYRPIPWDIVYLPGWQPMANGESTLAEDLADAGYHTGFVTDTMPYFAPGMNFNRGFKQWEQIRGQQQDFWKSPYAADRGRAKNMRTDWDDGHPDGLVNYHVANTDGLHTSEGSSTGRTFQWAMDFLEDNGQKAPFYLLVDCFDPHEPWDAPKKYYDMYSDGSFDGPQYIALPYMENRGGLSAEQVADTYCHYRGHCTLVDEWVGKLLDHLESLGLADNTLVVFTTDHGTNFDDNLWHVTGKPGWALLPGTMHIPLIVRHPSLGEAGQTIDGLRYNLDITATVYDVTGVSPRQPIDGNSLSGVLTGDHSGDRDYLTSRYENTVWYFDGRYWMFGDLAKDTAHCFDLETDPKMLNDLGKGPEDISRAAWERLNADAGGDIPEFDIPNLTDAIGR